MKSYNRSRRMCEWDDMEKWQDHFQDLLNAGTAGTLSPFLLLAMPGFGPQAQRLCSELWMADKLLQSKSARTESARMYRSQEQAEAKLENKITPTPPPAKIRLGYLSCDFHDHATALLLIEVLEAHDRERFELIAYSYGEDNGYGMRQRLEKTFLRFVDISAQSILESADTIHADGIDILIDLKGFTRDTRTEILSYRPAPVQVNYLGYPGTLGGDLCDYIITDRFVTPPSATADYSESFAYLPNTYQPHSRHSTIDPAPTRAAMGLPTDGFVFCCFNQTYKITADVFDVWCLLLARTPNSVLWLMEDKFAVGNLKNHALQRGILPDRLVFAAPVGQAEHLGRLQLADLVLDTLPCNAHTTASDALWAKVPLVTCAGDTFPSRVAGSLLLAIELPELITHNLDEYYALALMLANDTNKYTQLKTKLIENHLTTPLFDVTAYTRDLENLFQQMWDRHCAEQTCQMISV